MTTTQIYKGYVKTDKGSFYLQLPENNRWGFSLFSDDQSWPGGFGIATDWQIVPDEEVPESVKEGLGWVLKEFKDEHCRKKAASQKRKER